MRNQIKVNDGSGCSGGPSACIPAVDGTDDGGSFRYETKILPWKAQHEGFMRAYLEFVLDSLGGNISATSRVLGMNRAYLYKLINKYGVRRVKISRLRAVATEALTIIPQPGPGVGS